jgi:hypothetical protein
MTFYPLAFLSSFQDYETPFGLEYMSKVGSLDSSSFSNLAISFF